MDEKTDTIIKEYISAVAAENSKLRKAYIFGSYAKKNERPDSDIDIAIIIDDLKNEERFDLQVQLMLLASDFDIRIEPHPISNFDFNSEYPFANEIKATGIEINI